MNIVRKAVLLSGERGAGKTTLCLKLAAELPGAGGVVCPALFDGDGNKTGFTCVSIGSGESWELGAVKLKEAGGEAGQSTRKYHFSENGIVRGIACIRESLERDGGTTFIDEIGPLELSGGGFAPVLPLLASASNLIIVIRPALVDEVTPFLTGHRVSVFSLTKVNREELKDEIIAFLEGPS